MPRRKTALPILDEVTTLDLPAAADGSSADGAKPTRSKPGPKAASPAELARLLAMLTGGATDLLEAWTAVPGLAMTDSEATAIAQPAARLLMRAGLGKRVSKYLASSSDAVDLALALGAYGLRVAPAVSMKLEANAREKAQREQTKRTVTTVPGAASPSGGAASSGGGAASSGPGAGAYPVAPAAVAAVAAQNGHSGGGAAAIRPFAI